MFPRLSLFGPGANHRPSCSIFADLNESVKSRLGAAVRSRE